MALTTTPEALAAAQAARAAKTAARRASPLRRDFLDAPEWERLARVLSVRMPPWGEPPRSAVMSRFLHAVGKDWAWYYDWSGEHRKTDFAASNPAWPARAWSGLVLERVAAERGISA